MVYAGTDRLFRASAAACLFSRRHIRAGHHFAMPVFEKARTKIGWRNTQLNISFDAYIHIIAISSPHKATTQFK